MHTHAILIKVLMMDAVADLVSCLSHHLFAPGLPDGRDGDDPVKIGRFQGYPSFLEVVLDELVLQVFQDLCNHVHQEVLGAIAGFDPHLTAYRLHVKFRKEEK